MNDDGWPPYAREHAEFVCLQQCDMWARLDSALMGACLDEFGVHLDRASKACDYTWETSLKLGKMHVHMNVLEAAAIASTSKMRALMLLAKNGRPLGPFK